MKTRWGILFWVSAFLIGINGCDDSGAADSPDLCPDDPNKTGPGVCGCSVADDDLNNNTIPDCFDQEMDLCPEDPAKTLPGVCGCGIADEDTDGDTLPDCLGENIDLCPEDPAKTLPGVCGCGVADEDTETPFPTVSTHVRKIRTRRLRDFADVAWLIRRKISSTATETA